MPRRRVAAAAGRRDLDAPLRYRNDINEVQKFFDQRHGDHYKFYNLCSERAYPATRFHGRFERVPFDDHCPPPLGLFYYFCESCKTFLDAHPDNVAAIHCKAGKGRPGVMISAYVCPRGYS